MIINQTIEAIGREKDLEGDTLKSSNQRVILNFLNLSINANPNEQNHLMSVETKK